MIRIKLKPRQPAGSVLEASRMSGLTYPTYLDMTKGVWGEKALSALARFLFGCGIGAQALRQCKFSDIFDVEDE